MAVALDPRALVTLAEAKDWLNIKTANTVDDDEITTAINNASQRIHVEAEREFKSFGTNPQTRTFTIGEQVRQEPIYVDGQLVGIGGPGRNIVSVGDLASYTTVQILSGRDWTTVLGTPSAGQVRAWPLVREEWEPITRLEFRYDAAGFGAGNLVAVTGVFGFPVVPGTIKQAALDATAWIRDRDVENYRSDLGTLGGGSGEAPVIMVSGGAQRILSLPPPVLAACWAFRDTAVG